MPIPMDWYLVLSAILFIIGAAGVLLRRNLFIILFSIELMMNAVKHARARGLKLSQKAVQSVELLPPKEKPARGTRA